MGRAGGSTSAYALVARQVGFHVATVGACIIPGAVGARRRGKDFLPASWVGATLVLGKGARCSTEGSAHRT